MWTQAGPYCSLHETVFSVFKCDAGNRKKNHCNISFNNKRSVCYRGTRWCSWLRHCITNRKVAGSIPDYVIQIFHWHGPSGVYSASNRNYYHEYFLGGKGGRWVGLTTLPPSYANCLDIWERQPPGTTGPELPAPSEVAYLIASLTQPGYPVTGTVLKT